MNRHDYDPTNVDRRPPVGAILAGCFGFATFVLAIGAVALIAVGAL